LKRHPSVAQSAPHFRRDRFSSRSNIFSEAGRIIATLSAALQTIPEIVRQVYTDVPESLHKLAAMSVLAHLEKLEAEGRARRSEERFALVPTT
jgi:hypothetical protein